MAEKNRNRQDSHRSQNDWNEEGQRRHYGDESNYTNSENRGYGGNRSSSREEDSGWDNRNERQNKSNRQGEYGGVDNSGWQSDYDRSYGMSGQGTSGDSGSRGGSRNLYDRDYEGANRSNYQNRENRLGAGNYGSYGDRGRFDQNQSRGHGGSNYGGSQYSGYGQSGNRSKDYGSGEGDERSWWDRTTDKVSSWFGDEDAERRSDRDRKEGGQHKGKGPRNYNRSDDRIKEDINDRLSDDPFVDASEIDVTVSSGEVTLTGTVDQRTSKRRAEDIAEAVSGVKNVENRLRVGQSRSSESTGSPSGMNNASSMNNPSGSASMDSPSGSSSSQSSSSVPGSERGRQKENSYSNSK